MDKFDLSKRVKDLRNKKGITQEQLAEDSGLSLRTIQRLENGETVPRGDTLKRLAVSLQVSPEIIIDWQVEEDKNVLTMLNLSQLGFLPFPLLGIILPLTIWIIKKDKIKDVSETGKSILNFQITWTIALCSTYALLMAGMVLHLEHIKLNFSFAHFIFMIGFLYLYNISIIFINTIRCYRKKKVYYQPALPLLR
ncbi:helix-turn-helix domain-containing protein [Xanthovirga aplysinae]|uniref:helix-turn-helix domain-containing protein n=1 Tax=Xanthovirga aplysinae TaxID=2529853 RepID=UPI0012BD5B69|nr:helix-turn-helix domain-containing protein [Xanthovirga aplysinae]MTI32752.1 helix-turn-helix domain-containing protein [Xanthovirga aplysinae]